jgi:electron-transferring-flavoprotein dehydrogenase
MGIAPAEFPPPGDPAEDYVTEPTDPEEERIEVGVAIVGGGPAGLACAIKTMQLLEDEPELAEKLGEVPVAVIEKGQVTGAHLLSGANMRPSAMEELFPDLDRSEWPVYQEVTKDAVYLLTKRNAIPLKPPPPNFRNHGNYVTSIAKLGRFLGEKAEEAGAYLLTETAADKLLVEERVVKGVRSGDKGRGRDGEELGNFEPGSDVIAKATVLAEGTQGHLTGAAMDFFELHGLEAQRWELGVKEIWEVEKPLDRVIHTMGWPLRKGAKWNEFGGSFIYPMGEDKVCIGFVAGLDYTDATFSVHDTLQEFKTHPFVRKILEGGKRVGWGAKTIPSGGYWALPRTFTVPGMIMCGDGAGMCNVSELKGIHYAMHAGMYAAEEIVAALKQDSVNFDAYDERVRNSAITQDLYKWRNVRQAFGRGFFFGGAVANMALLTRGALPPGRWSQHPDSEEAMEPDGASKRYPKPDNKYTFDKLSSVFASGNATRDDAPNHIKVQRRVPREVAETWVAMCPAQVYEIPEDQAENGAKEIDLNITPSNCVQCGAITAKGGRLTPPEGGDGPRYQET